MMSVKLDNDYGLHLSNVTQLEAPTGNHLHIVRQVYVGVNCNNIPQISLSDGTMSVCVCTTQTVAEYWQMDCVHALPIFLAKRQT